MDRGSKSLGDDMYLYWWLIRNHHLAVHSCREQAYILTEGMSSRINDALSKGSFQAMGRYSIRVAAATRKR